jgi:hypothetical protein
MEVMDLSKLPKLSQTPPQAATPASSPAESAQPEAPPTGPAPKLVPVVLVPSLADAWFSLAIGIIVLLVFPHTIEYLHSPATFQQNNPVTDPQNNPIPYPHSEFFYADLGMTVFGVALIIEGLAQIVALRRPVVLSVFVLTSAAGLFNLYVVIRTYNVIGFQLFCAVAVAISGYMALSQWSIAKLLRHAPR